MTAPTTTAPDPAAAATAGGFLPTVTVAYGPDNVHRVELRRIPGDCGLEGRYLGSPDGIGRPTEWERRDRDDGPDGNAAVLDAFAAILDAFAYNRARDRAEEEHAAR